MEDGRKEEAIERAGCNVRIARRRIPGVKVVANPCHSCLLHSACALINVSSECKPMQLAFT